MFHSKWVIIDRKKRGDIMDIYKRIYELENEIAALPQGSINMKKIYGKEQPYLQWTENGKSKSKYIKKNEREEIFAGVERRKQLQEELKELKQHSSIDPSKSTDFETSVIIGERLLALTKGVKNWGKRDCFRQLQAYLNSEETDRVPLHGIFKSILYDVFHFFLYYRIVYRCNDFYAVVQVAWHPVCRTDEDFLFSPRCKYKYTGMFQIAVDDTVYPDIFTYSLYACYQ